MRLAVGAILLTFVSAARLDGQPASEQLARIYTEYEAQSATPDVATLVRLDGQVRRLLRDREVPLDASELAPGYERLGLSPGLFDRNAVSYDGKLLRDAHRADPNSAFRALTLFSTVESRSGEVPSPRRADAYLREFPDGAFATDTLRLLAHFYDDLYKVITLRLAGQRADDKYECYRAFLSPPLTEQVAIARASAIEHYRRVLARDPGDRSSAHRVGELEMPGPFTLNAWHFCPD